MQRLQEVPYCAVIAEVLGGRMMRIAIVGVGAIGGALAGFLDQAEGHDLVLSTRRPIPQFDCDLA